MTDRITPIPAWRVVLDGKDLTDIMAPRLISLTLTEKRSGEADDIELTLNDSDGLLQIPKRGVTLTVALGWVQGRNVIVGLVEKGTFKVDEAGSSGPPDIITIRARSADFSGAFRIRKERSFVGHTIGAIIAAIASDNGLKARIDNSLSHKVIPALGSGAKSDSSLLYELGQKFDAVATIKAGYLIFAPVGKGVTASGAAIPSETIARKVTDGPYHYEDCERSKYDGAEAVYHDFNNASHVTVTAGHTGTGKAKRLRKIYANATDAQHAAEAEAKRISRSAAKLEINMLGRPDMFPNKGIQVSGFKDEINARPWLISEVRHTMSGKSAFTSALTLEAGFDGDNSDTA